MENLALRPTSNSFLLARALAKLTSREWDILLKVSKDLTSAEIANQLCLAVKSVENYRSRIETKLGYEGPPYWPALPVSTRLNHEIMSDKNACLLYLSAILQR